MKEIKHNLSTFVIPFYYGSGTVINYGSGSATVPFATLVADPDLSLIQEQLGHWNAANPEPRTKKWTTTKKNKNF